MVVEMRKIRLGFTEVMMAINKIKERDNKARIRKEQTIKKSGRFKRKYNRNY